MRTLNATAEPPDETPPSLSLREREVLRLRREGLSLAEIAAVLSITERAVRTSLGRTTGKLGRDRPGCDAGVH